MKHNEKEVLGMFRNMAIVIGCLLVAWCLYVIVLVLLRQVEKSSSFVGYSQSCWQVGDTLHVVTAKGDTVRLDVSRLEGER